jgi:tRNA threonylcarbamoyladenosine modification (KEOPS) complex  Pcc1 subunit
MKSTIQIETKDSDTLENILSPSLESRGKVELDIDKTSQEIIIDVETEGLGPLRGTTDNIFRLSSLAKKIYET